MICLPEFTQHVTCHRINICLILRIMEFSVHFRRFRPRRGKAGMLGHRIISLNHTIRIQDMDYLTEARNVLSETSCRRVLVFSHFRWEGSRAIGCGTWKRVQMPFVIEPQEGACSFLLLAESEHSGVSWLNRIEEGAQGIMQRCAGWEFPEDRGG